MSGNERPRAQNVDEAAKAANKWAKYSVPLDEELAMLSNTKAPFSVGRLRSEQRLEATKRVIASTQAALKRQVEILLAAEKELQCARPLNAGGDLELARKETTRAIHEAFQELAPEDVEVLMAKTKRGDTQASERNAIAVLGACFKRKGLSFDSAGSQQPYDFLNIGFEELRGYSRHALGIRLEHKHTNSNVIKCNDTPPSDNDWTFYVLCKSPTKKRRGFVALISSLALRSGSDAFIRTNEFIVRDVLRAEFAKASQGAVTSYPRANYSCNLAALDIEHDATYVRFVEAR